MVPYAGYCSCHDGRIASGVADEQRDSQAKYNIMKSIVYLFAMVLVVAAPAFADQTVWGTFNGDLAVTSCGTSTGCPWVDLGG